MWVGRELIDDLSSGSMPDLYTAVGGECGAADLQHNPVRQQDSGANTRNLSTASEDAGKPDHHPLDIASFSQ